MGYRASGHGLTDAAYFHDVYKEAVELCAFLCKRYRLDPAQDGVLIGHYEGYRRGIANNHADPGHWFLRFGKSMDSFRGDVKALITGGGVPELVVPVEIEETVSTSEPTIPASVVPKKLYRIQIGAYSVKANAEAMLAKVKAAGFKDAFIKSE